MTTTLQTTTKVSRRRRGIEPFLLQLDEALAMGEVHAMRFAPAGPEAPLVPLDPWAVRWIQACALKPKGPPELSELLKQCLSFLVKSATDVSRLRKEDPRAAADFYAVQAELMLGSAVGMALMRETQKGVHDLVELGAVDDAKLLTRLESRLRSTVRDLKFSLLESNRGRDDELVEQFTDTAAPQATARASHTLEIPEALLAAAQRSSTPALNQVQAAGAPFWRRLRTPILFVSVMVALFVWLAGRALPSLAGASAKVVTRADFNGSAPILQVVAPPPSAYIVVDPARWAAYDEGQQRRLVEVMGGVLVSNDYWGLLVRTPDGKSVARWVDGRGSDLLHIAPALPAAPSDGASSMSFDRFVPEAAPRRIVAP